MEKVASGVKIQASAKGPLVPLKPETIFSLRLQRIEHEPSGDLRIKVGRLLGHRLARFRDGTYLVDTGGVEQERGGELPRLDARNRLILVFRIDQASRFGLVVRVESENASG